MIVSILDNDLYKFTMQNFALKFFPDEFVCYEFFNRDNREFPEGFADKLRSIVDEMKYLSLDESDFAFLQTTFPFFDNAYLSFLKSYKFDSDEVQIEQEGKKLKISVTGYWVRTILWEVPLMAMISELYHGTTRLNRLELSKIDKTKVNNLSRNNITFTEFGTRRRFSFLNHQNVIENILETLTENFAGTSNLFFAKKYNIKCLGTMAHEVYSLMAGIYGFLVANDITLSKWFELYQGRLSIFLPDTFGTEKFLSICSYKHAANYTGARQDSGDPIEFAYKLFNFYIKLGINPKTKTVLFSDSLNDEKAIEINKKVKNMFGFTNYCIGTFFTCDIPDVKPLNIVIKLVGRRNNKNEWTPLIKLSDNIGKNTGDLEMIKLCNKTFSLFSI